MSIREASPSIGAALGRTQSFMLLGGLLAVLLAGVAVALAAHRYARRHYDHVAILKTLGATPTEIQWGYLGLLGLVGAIASAAGLGLGVALHLGILSRVVGVSAGPFAAAGNQTAARRGCRADLCVWRRLALPPLLSLRSISPMRVMRRDLEHAGVSRWLTYACAAFGGLALLIWYTNNWRLTLWTLVGVVGVSAVFSVGGARAAARRAPARNAGRQHAGAWRLPALRGGATKTSRRF